MMGGVVDRDPIATRQLLFIRSSLWVIRINFFNIALEKQLIFHFLFENKRKFGLTKLEKTLLPAWSGTERNTGIKSLR